MKTLILSIILAAMSLAASAAEPWSEPQQFDSIAADSLVAWAVGNGRLVELLEAAEERYFWPLSEAASEERMAEILRAALACGKLSDDDASTARWMLHDVCEVNAPDSLAADIDIELPDGTHTNLYQYKPGSPLVVVFYDPTCRHCSSVMSRLTELASLIDVLAVCVDSPHTLWATTRDGLNPGWVSAYDLSRVTETDAYVIRSLPGIYLLDADRRVVLKNPNPERLLSTLKGGDS